MKIYFVYILLCSDDSYYVGFTNNLQRRLLEHSNKRNPYSYTSKRLPVRVVYFERYDSPIIGIYREKQIKGWSRIKKEALIEKRYDDLPKLSRKKNRTKDRF